MAFIGCSDQVLNGAFDSEADNTHGHGYVQSIGSVAPCRSVIIQGGYHSTSPEVAPSKSLPAGSNGSLVLIGAVEGAIIQVLKTPTHLPCPTTHRF